MDLYEILNSNFVSGIVAALVSSVIALIGVIISLVWSTGKAKEGMEKALKIYESELTRKVYASSKRLDLEYDMYRKLNGCCSEIFRLMQQLYPDRLSTLQIQCETKTSLNELSVAIGSFEREINFSIPFIPDELLVLYKTLLEDAETFFSDATKHNAYWDDTKDDRTRKSGLRDVAYKARMSFDDHWKKVGAKVNQHLAEKEHNL